VSGEREQNWYPIGEVGWFTQHIRQGIEVTAGQLDLLQPALAQPYRLDDAIVTRIIQVHQDQAEDLVLFQNQADRWNASPSRCTLVRIVNSSFSSRRPSQARCRGVMSFSVTRRSTGRGLLGGR
jgi:hypothetical protein